MDGNRDVLCGLTFNDILNEDGKLKVKEQIELRLGFGLLAMEYRRLTECINYVVKRFKPVLYLRHNAQSVDEILQKIKRGSFKLRKMMSGRGSRAYREFTYDKVRPINTLWNQIGIEKDNNLIWVGMHLWGIKELNCDVRQFIFKWNQGMIHGNTVIYHFRDVDRKCTFCKIKEEK
jgi:hypothetical protein